jgi:hypothetical protein
MQQLEAEMQMQQLLCCSSGAAARGRCSDVLTFLDGGAVVLFFGSVLFALVYTGTTGTGHLVPMPSFGGATPPSLNSELQSTEHQAPGATANCK